LGHRREKILGGKKVKALLLFFWAVSAGALPLENCVEGPVQALTAEQQLLSASESLWQAKCPEGDELFLVRAKGEFERLFPASAPRAMGSVGGVKLIGSAAEAAAFEAILGVKPPANWPAVAVKCKTILCAATKLFGSEESALRAFSIAARTGYIVKLDQNHNPAGQEQVWSAAEVRAIDQSLQLLPAEFYRLPTLEGFYRMKDGYRLKDHSASVAAFADANTKAIVCYETMHKHSDGLMSIILHEIFHHHDFSGVKEGEPQHSHSQFSQISGWDKGSQTLNPATGQVEEKFTSRPGAKFVRDYAASSPFEDYAESLTYYLLKPRVLRQADPEKYNFIREKIFRGKVFTGGITGLAARLADGKWVQEALANCESRMPQYSLDESGKPTKLYYPAPSSATETRYWVAKDTVNFLEICSEHEIAKFLATFPAKDEFCTKEGHRFLKGWLASHGSEFDALLGARSRAKRRP
jgi:hypothetical protein